MLVIGAGKVGQAAARALKRKGVTVYVLDREGGTRKPGGEGRRCLRWRRVGPDLIERAGISRVASVLLTTNDDAVNIYLAVFCRKLNPALRIVSRITHERNVEAIHRAGADFVLSYTSLGVESIMSLLSGDATITLGEGVGCSRCRCRRRWPGSRCRGPGSGRTPDSASSPWR